MIKKKTVNYLFISLIAHYLFYPFYIGNIPNSLQQIVIFGLFLLYAFFNFETIVPLFAKLGQYKKYMVFAATLYAIVLGSAFLVPFIYGTGDLSYFAQHFRQVLFLSRYIILLAIIRTHISSYNLKDQVLKLFTEATRDYVIFTIILITIPKFRSIWINIIHETASRIELLNLPSYFARIGWAGYSGFSMTFFCTLSALFSLYLILKSMQNKKGIPKSDIISLLFALIGNSFYGRAGLLTSLLLIGISVIYMIFINKKFHYALMLIFGIIGVFLFLTFLQQFSSTLASWYNWMMQPIISLLETGTIQTSSTDTLWTMWFIPDPIMLIFGNGFYTSPIGDNYYMSTDVGLLRPVLFFGIFLTTLLYLIPIILIGAIGTKTRLNRHFAFMMILSLFIFEVKAESVQLLIPLVIMLFLAEFAGELKKDKQISIETKFFKGSNKNVELYNSTIFKMRGKN